MRRLIALAAAILLLLPSFSTAMALPRGAELLQPVPAYGGASPSPTPISTSMPTATPASTPVPTATPASTPVPITTPVPAPETASPSTDPEADAPLPEVLLSTILELLEARDYTLTCEDTVSGATAELTLHRLDEDSLEITYENPYGPVRIVADAEGYVLYGNGISRSYSYEDLLEELLDSIGLDGAGLSDMSAFSKEPLTDEESAFLREVLWIALEEMTSAGMDLDFLYTGDEGRISLDLSPRMLNNAFVRFVDRVLEREEEVDALLLRSDPLLRALFPNIYEIYNPATGQYVQRVAYTCAELKAAWQGVRRQLLNDRPDGPSLHLDFCEAGEGTGLFNLAASGLFDSSDRAVLTLDIDERGSSTGTLIYRSGYGDRLYLFDIQLTASDSGLMLRVTPRNSTDGFSGLLANFAAGDDGALLSLSMDGCMLRFTADYTGINFKLQISDDLAVDLRLTLEGGYPHGSLIYSEYGGGYELRLNE